MKRVILISPPIYDFAAFDLWLRPLGLLYVSSILKEFGYDVTLIDTLDRYHPLILSNLKKFHLNEKKFGTGKFINSVTSKPEMLLHIKRKFRRYGLGENELKNILSGLSTPDIIGTGTTMTYWYLGLKEVYETCHSFFPDTPIILGGIYSILCHEHALKVFPDISVTSASSPAEILSIFDNAIGIKRDYSEIHKKTLLDFIPDYSSYSKLYSCGMLLSIGCPFSCTYCASTKLHKGNFMFKNPSVAIDEIISYANRGVRDIAFYDDALLYIPFEILNEVFTKINERNLGIRFHTPNGLHIRKISKEVAALLFRAGFKTIRLSYEGAGDVSFAKSSFKGNSSDFNTAVFNLLNAGFPKEDINVYLLAGLPGQERKEVENACINVHNLGLKIKLSFYSPIPWTEDYKNSTEMGLSLSEPLLHNPSIFPLAPTIFPYDYYEDLKSFTVSLNDKLS